MRYLWCNNHNATILDRSVYEVEETARRETGVKQLKNHGDPSHNSRTTMCVGEEEKTIRCTGRKVDTT